MAIADLEYACYDGIWTKFFPNTEAGDEAWNEMARQDKDGVVAFLPHQLPGVLYQLRKAGYVVRKERKTKNDKMSIDELLDELERL